MLIELPRRAILPGAWQGVRREHNLDKAVWAAVTGVSYFVAAWLTAALTTPEGVAPCWPAAGIGVGALIIAGRHARLSIGAAIVAASFLANWIDGRTVPVSAAFAIGNAGEALTVAILAARWIKRPFELDRLRSVLGLFAASALGTAAWQAVAATAFAVASPAAAPIGEIWVQLVWANFTGIVLVAPLVTALPAALLRPPPWRLAIEGGAVLFLQALASAHAFGQFPIGFARWMTTIVPLSTQLPLLLWLAVRCGPLFAASGALVLGLAMLRSFSTGRGVFGNIAYPVSDRLLAMHFAIPVSAFVALAIAALIAERRDAEQAARRSEARLKLSLDAGGFGTWELEPRTSAFEASSEALQYFGFRQDSPVPFTAVLSALHPADRQLLEAEFRRLAKEGGDFERECRALWPDGSVHWLHIMGRAADVCPGGYREIAGAVRDVSEQKSIASLRESAEQMRLFVEQAPVAIAMFDREMRYLAASERWIASYGLDARGLTGRHLYQAVPDMPEAWKEVHRRALLGEVLSGDQDPIEMKRDGRVHWMRWEVRPWRAPNGAIGGIVIFTEDVTARVEAERALRQSRQALDRAQAVARTGSWRLNVDRNELTWSAEAYRMFGITPGTPLTYESFLAATHPEDRERVDKNWKAALAGAPYDIEHRIVAHGEVRWVREKAELEYDAAGKLAAGFGTVQDITDKKQAEEELLRLQRLTQLISDRAPDAIFLTDEKGCITYANPEAARLFEYRLEEMTGQGLHDLLHHHHLDGSAYPRNDCPLSKIQDSGATIRNHEDALFRKDGSPIDVACSYAPLEQGSERSGGVFVVRDISSQKAAQAALRESEERLRLSNEAAGIGTFTLDLEANRAYYSLELATMLGFPWVRTAKIDDAFARVHRDDVAGVRAQYEAGLRKPGGQIKMDFRFVRPGGEVRWMTWMGRVDYREKPSGPEPFRVAGACVDITGRKRAEEATAQLAAIVTSSSDAIIGITVDGTIWSWNEAAVRLFGFSSDEMTGQSVNCLVPPGREGEEEDIQRSVAGGKVVEHYETVRLHKSGRHLEVSVTVSPIRNAAGKITGFSRITRDISERKRHDEKVQLLLREVNHRAKNMLALVQAIASRTAAPDHAEFMKRFSERLSALAASQDLLVGSAWQGVDIAALVRSQLSHFKSLIDDRIKLKGPPLILSAPAAQTIGMALHELATNAGKYGALSSGEGGIRIEWGLRCGADGDKRCELSWAEHGGPPVRAPEKRGFGTTVIETIPRMELEAEVTLGYAAEGLHWRLDCPAERVVESPETGNEGG